MRGRMDFESGVGELQFGDFVDPATLTDGLKAEWRQSAADVGAVGGGGKIWRPGLWTRPYAADQPRCPTVPLPTDANILGSDPVRPPPDGRVCRIYRKGHLRGGGRHGAAFRATYSAGMTINRGRERLLTRLLWSRGRQADPAAATPPT